MTCLRSSLAVPNCVNGMLEESKMMDSAQNVNNVVSTGEGTVHDRGAVCMLSSAAVYEELIHDTDHSGWTAHGGQNDTLFKLQISWILEFAHTMQNRTAYKLDSNSVELFFKLKAHNHVSTDELGQLVMIDAHGFEVKRESLNGLQGLKVLKVGDAVPTSAYTACTAYITLKKGFATFMENRIF